MALSDISRNFLYPVWQIGHYNQTHLFDPLHSVHLNSLPFNDISVEELRQSQIIEGFKWFFLDEVCNIFASCFLLQPKRVTFGSAF